MFKYGSVIDEDILPKNRDIYSLITKYFDNPTMTKTENNSGFSMYTARMPCSLINEYRYIFAMVRQDNNQIGTQVSLSDINWEVFQARITDKNYGLKIHSYSPKRSGEFVTPIILDNRDNENTSYTSKLPIHVILIHPKTSSFMRYPDNGTLAAALETYRTVISHRE